VELDAIPWSNAPLICNDMKKFVNLTYIVTYRPNPKTYSTRLPTHQQPVRDDAERSLREAKQEEVGFI